MVEGAANPPALEPTTGASRISWIDAARGLAVLLILLANITVFFGPMEAQMDAARLLSLPPGERMVEALREAFIAGKFRSLLSIIFGAGIWLQFQKREAAGLDWPGSFVKRMMMLLAIGSFHRLVIWHGDILVDYSVCACAAALMIKVRDKVKLWVVGGLFAVFCFLGVALAIVSSLPGGHEMLQGGMEIDLLTAKMETSVYSQGPVWMQFAHRALMYVIGLLNLPLFGAMTIALMLVGVLAAKRGWLTGDATKGEIMKVGTIALLVGVPLNALPILAWKLHAGFDSSLLTEAFSGPVLAVGLFCLAAGILPRLHGAATGLFERIGRVSLSVYLLQSVICTTLAYSYGLRLFGRLSASQELTVVAFVWLVCIVAALIWTHWFAIGPVEWVWRSWEAGKPLSWRKASALAKG